MSRLDKQTHRNHFDTIGLRRDDARSIGGGKFLHAEHGGRVGTVNIRIHQPDASSSLSQSHCHVDRDRRLAHAAFAGTDGDRITNRHVDQSTHAPVVGDIRIHFDVYGFDTFDSFERIATVRFDLAFQRTSWRGEHHRKRYLVAFDLQVTDHVERDKILTEVRFLHSTKCF